MKLALISLSLILLKSVLCEDPNKMFMKSLFNVEEIQGDSTLILTKNHRI